MRCMQMGVPRFIRRALVAVLLPCSLARADVVADWNAIALKTVTSSEQNPAYVARTMATVHVAMFEVMNFIEGVYVSRFLVKPPAPLGRSGEAATAAAAHYVLGELHPGQKAALDAALERSLASIPDGQEKSNARIWGRHLGANVYAVRSPHWDDTSRVHASTPESVASVVALNTTVARFIEARRLKPIDGARVHALASMAASDAYAASRAANSTPDSGYPCAACAIGAATLVILESEFGPASVTGIALPDSIKAGEEIGRKIGMQALTAYRSTK